MAGSVEGKIQPCGNKFEVKAKVLRKADPLTILLSS